MRHIVLFLVAVALMYGMCADLSAQDVVTPQMEIVTDTLYGSYTWTGGTPDSAEIVTGGGNSIVNSVDGSGDVVLEVQVTSAPANDTNGSGWGAGVPFNQEWNNVDLRPYLGAGYYIQFEARVASGSGQALRVGFQVNDVGTDSKALEGYGTLSDSWQTFRIPMADIDEGEDIEGDDWDIVDYFIFTAWPAQVNTYYLKNIQIVHVVLDDDYDPVADAGADQTVIDQDDTGSQNVTLDGSGTTDDIGVASYSWVEGSTEIATGETPVVDLAIGVHTIVLTVTDGSAQTDEDTVVITVLEDNDGDDDGMDDEWELANGLNPADPADAAANNDTDDLTNLEEFTAGTNPNKSDTDGDGVSDSDEIIAGTDPLYAPQKGSVAAEAGCSFNEKGNPGFSGMLMLLCSLIGMMMYKRRL